MTNRMLRHYDDRDELGGSGKVFVIVLAAVCGFAGGVGVCALIIAWVLNTP